MSSSIKNNYHTGDDALSSYASTSLIAASYSPVYEEGPNVSRQGYSQSDYDHYRPSDALPTSHTDIMFQSLMAYETVGPIRNIIDLVSDLASAGIRLSHPNARNEKLYQNWFSRIDGPAITERIAANLEKFATCIIRRDVERVTKRVRKDLQQSKATIEEIKTKKFYIPTGYTMLNPCMVDVINEAASSFLPDSKITYAYKIPQSLKTLIKYPKTDIEKKFVEKLPEDVIQAINSNNPKNLFPIPNQDENLEVIHYKKDSWQAWAKPVVYGVLQDVKLLNKLKLADFSVVDSAIDQVRIFKLGSLDHKILPGDGALSILASALEANNPGGVRNIIWGPDIELLESQSTGFYDILGNEKYESSWNNIHSGMGIPPTLTGTSAGGGTTNNLLSLKTLIKRLSYIRQRIIEFWQKEIEIFRRAYGLRNPAEIEFDIINFGDEETEKKLWIELVDRNIISEEWLQVKFGANPTIENNRLNKEHKARRDNKRVPKGGPYHTPEWERECKKLLVQQGLLDPKELNLDLKDELNLKEIDDIPNLKDPNTETGNSPEGDNNTPDNIEPTDKGGRPKGTPDGKPRKKRVVKPIQKAARLWAAEAQEKISKLLNPHISSYFEVKSIRELNLEQFSDAEMMKFFALSNLTPFSDLNEEIVLKAASNHNTNHNLYQEYINDIKEIEKSLGRKLNVSERKEIQRDILFNGQEAMC